MMEARIREFMFYLFDKWYWQHVIQRWFHARIRRCRSCSKLFLSFMDWETCPLCSRNESLEYGKRRLQELRTMPYAEYLQTSHWYSERLGALDRAGYRCQLCNSTKRLDVHHRTYENLGHEKPEDLLVLCHKDHEHFHLGERNE